MTVAELRTLLERIDGSRRVVAVDGYGQAIELDSHAFQNDNEHVSPRPFVSYPLQRPVGKVHRERCFVIITPRGLELPEED